MNGRVLVALILVAAMVPQGDRFAAAQSTPGHRPGSEIAELAWRLGVWQGTSATIGDNLYEGLDVRFTSRLANDRLEEVLAFNDGGVEFQKVTLVTTWDFAKKRYKRVSVHEVRGRQPRTDVAYGIHEERTLKLTDQGGTARYTENKFFDEMWIKAEVLRAGRWTQTLSLKVTRR